MGDPLIDALIGTVEQDAARNPFITIGRGLSQPIDLGPDADPWATIGTAFGQGLIGGAASTYGRNTLKNNFEDRSKKLADYSGFAADPSILADSIAHDSDPLLAALAPTIRMDALQRQKARAVKQQEIADAALGAGMNEKAKIFAQNQAYSDLQDPSGVPNPESPQGKAAKVRTEEEDARRKEILGTPTASGMTAILGVLPTLEEMASDNTKTSDLPFIYKFIQSQDGGVVKDGERLLVTGSSPLLKQFEGLINGTLNGGSEITPEYKQQMVGEAKRNALAQYNALKMDAEPILRVGERRGGKRENMMPWTDEIINSRLRIAAGLPGSESVGRPAPAGVPTKAEFMQQMRAAGAIK